MVLSTQSIQSSPRKSESSPLLEFHEHVPANTNWWRLVLTFWVCIYMIYYLLLCKATASHGTYNYSTSNLYTVWAGFSAIMSYFIARFTGSDPLQSFTFSTFVQYLIPTFAGAAAGLFQMFAVAQIGPSPVAVLAFGRVIWTAWFQYVYSGLIPDRSMKTSLFLIGLLIALYLYVVSQHAMSIIGVVNAMLAYFLFEFSIITSGHIALGAENKNEWDMMFIQYCVYVPCYYACTPIEQYLTGTLTILDYIPGYRLTGTCWILVFGVFLGVTSQTLTAGWNLNYYIIATYAGLFLVTFTEQVLNGFVGFKMVPFALGAIIAVASFNYVFCNRVNREVQTFLPIKSVLQASGGWNAETVERIARRLSAAKERSLSPAYDTKRSPV